MKLSNRVREYRERAGYSRSELAERIGITRQSLGLIELNKVNPSTAVSLQLARIFEVRVEDLFFNEENSGTATVWPDDPIKNGDRIMLANINGRQVARSATGIHTYRIPPLTAVALNSPENGQIHYEKSQNTPLTDSLIMAGCDPGLELLAEHLQHPVISSKMNVLWLGVNNTQAIRQLSHSMVHTAAVHYSFDDIPRQAQEVTRIQFSKWEIGWVVKRGNPTEFNGVDRLVEGKTRLVNRPIGSGARDLLDDLIEKRNLSTSSILQYDWEVPGHRQVAEAVVTGMADVGIATATAASMLHLDFIPIRTESSELWFPNHRLETSGVRKLLDTLNSDLFRWDMERLGPCDVTHTGKIINEK